ncbi:hypothetical protein [Phaeocystidibacter luteus]|uniref:Uncharacterized protein n=1 Tax=Phaeocystidibacter luteus TaxID=911197 RepID=A0A6N6RGW4_9FLAO|nr:hypothetical protein [Phaeocystidibacter luteus]KAB2809983.1 hypothetical protein F8C67_08875 [Phaeocystidibacter luteus]
MNLSVTSNANEIEITYEMSPAANSNTPRYALVFLFEGSNVSPANYTAFTEVRQANSSPTTITITASELSDFGFTSGEQIYVRVYGDSFYSNDYEENGASVFPNVNLTSAQAVSVVVP